MMHSSALIHVVDDDPALRESLAFLLGIRGYEVCLYETAAQFLSKRREGDGRACCVLTDIRMPGTDGLDLIRALQTENDVPAVIVMTAHADVTLAVEAIRAGALDVLEKPFDDGHLFYAIAKALYANPVHKSSNASSYLSTLSPRERQVLQSIAAGNPNKATAISLGISPRTVEVYRAKLMMKTGAQTMAELMRIAVAAGL